MAINAFQMFGMSYGMQSGGVGTSPFGSSASQMLGTLGGGMMGGMFGGMMGGGIGAMFGGLLGGMFGGAMAGHFGGSQQSGQMNGGFTGYPQAGGQGWGGQQTGCWQQQQHCCCHCCCHHGMPQKPGQNWGGSLNQEKEGKPIQYTTSGGYKISIDKDKVSVLDKNGNTITQSGDPHEYVNGKHVKDWDEKTRTLILDDGTRITMNAPAKNGVIQQTSIYDGSQMVQIDNDKNKITGRSFDPYQTYYTEKNQADGETAFISHDQKGGLIYQDIYSQNANLGITPLFKEIFRTPALLAA